MSTTTLPNVLQAVNIIVGQSDVPKPVQSRSTLSAVLRRRLEAIPSAFNVASPPETASEQSCQLCTANAATSLLERLLACVEECQAHSAPSSSSATQPPPSVFSVKDMQSIGMLAGIVARWGIGLRLEEGVLPPSVLGATSRGKIVQVDIDHGARESPQTSSHLLASTLKLLLDVTRPGQTDPDRRQLAQVVAPQVLLPLLAGLLQLSHSSDLSWPREALKSLCASTSATVVISNLLALLSSPSSSATVWLKPAVASLLSAQLLRPTGVRSLLLVVISPGSAAGGDDDVSFKKLDMLTRLLGAKPSSDQQVDEKEHFATIVEQLHAIVHAAVTASLAATPHASGPGKGKTTSSTTQPVNSSPPIPILRASIFVLCHLMLLPAASTSAAGDQARDVMRCRLHAAFIPHAYSQAAVLPASLSVSTASLEESEDNASSLDLPPPLVPSREVIVSLTTLSLILLYAPPLPNLVDELVSPIVPSLLSLACFTIPSTDDDGGEGISSRKKSSIFVGAEHDGRFGDESSAILRTWITGVGVERAVKGFREAVEEWESGREFGAGDMDDLGPDHELEWSWSEDDGGVCVRRKSRSANGVDAEEADLEMRVDAAAVVRLLKDAGRKDVSGGLFLRWLDEVGALRTEMTRGSRVELAKRSVTRLQLVLQMVDAMGSDILTEPVQIIAFVAHALDADETSPEVETTTPARDHGPTQREGSTGITLADLKFVDSDEVEKVERQEEDEAEEPVIPGFGRDEMALTALTLLLAVLEAHEDLNTTTVPLLSLIWDRLDSFAGMESEFVPPLAREAKLVLSARRAASAVPSSSNGDLQSDPLAASRSTYQEALRLLQDPILPVRAHGLSLLRSLVRSPESYLATDPALLPAVLDIFVQSLEDEDSFLYLNAVQGLSSLADVFGKQVVRRLVEVYTGGTRSDEARRHVGTGEKGRRELDKRLRMGEALVQVVQRAGEALGVIVDDLVPPLLFVLRTPTLPTPLRSSALTILATTIESSPLALLPHADDLSEACVTLLTVESRPLQPRRREPAPPTKPIVQDGSDPDSDDDDHASPPLGRDGKPKRPEETPDPVERIDSKHPALRRAAMLFLGLLFRAVSSMEYDESERLSTSYDSNRPLLSGLGGSAGLRMPSISPRRTIRNGAFSSQSGTTSMLLSRERKERAQVVLRYIRETDEDSLVRHQAGEVLDEMVQ